MTGKRGMKPKRSRTDTVRAAIWDVMRVHRTFTIIQLMEALIERYPAMTYENTQKFVRRLTRYGYLAKVGQYRGGRAGTGQRYHLCSSEIALPVLGVGRSEKFLKKEEEKEKERKTKTKTGGAP